MLLPWLGEIDSAPFEALVPPLTILHSDRLGSKLQGTTSTSRGRLQRNSSLSSIAGSPAQTLDFAPPPALISADIRAASNKMARIGSVDQYNRYAPRSHASFSLAPPLMASSHSFVASSPRTEMANWSANVAASTADDQQDPNLLPVRSLEHDFATPVRPRPTRLGSAFHSPTHGVYPSPDSMKKVKSNVGLGLFGDAMEETMMGADSIPRRFFLAGNGNHSETFDDDSMSYDSDHSYSSIPTTSSRALSPLVLQHPHPSPRHPRKRSFFSSSLSAYDTREPKSSLPGSPMMLSTGSILGATSPMSSHFDLNDLSLTILDTGLSRTGGAGGGDSFAGASALKEWTWSK